MADRFPIILNTSANQLQEMPAGDTLDVSGAGVKANLVDSLSVVGTGVSIVGVVTATTVNATSFVGSGADINGDLDVDGHTNLDNVSVAGVSTFAGEVHVNGGTIRVTNDDFILGAASGDEIFLTANAGDRVIAGRVNAQTEIFYDNQEKIRTTNTGATVTGTIVATGADINGDLDVDGHTELDNVNVTGVTTFNDNVHFKLNDKLYFGNNNELEIYQQGNNSIIENNDDTFLIRQSGSATSYPLRIHGGSSLELKYYYGNGGQQFLLNGIRGAQTEIYYSGVKKFETTSTGVLITGNNVVSGNVTAVDGTFSGNLSIGGTLTYEDVTNIDSLGIVTARSGVISPYADIDDFISVGSNIHLGNAGVCTATTFVGALSGNATSADTVDVTNDSSANTTFYPTFVNGAGSGKTLSLDTGLTYVPSSNVLTAGTFSGSGASLTNLNGSNIASGTVPVARIGTGTKNSSTFYRGDGTFAVVTSVGGNTGVDFNDNVQVRFGTGNDAQLLHTGGQFRILNDTGDFYIKGAAAGNGDMFIEAKSGTTNARFFANSGATFYFAGNERIRVNNLGINVGTSHLAIGATVETNGQATFTGIVTASSFKLSDGSNVGGVDSDAQGNTVGGTNAGGNFNTSGNIPEGNTLFGKNAGDEITYSLWSTAVGYDALKKGSYNTAVGYQALMNNTGDTGNTAIGVQALRSCTTGSAMVAVGYGALYSTTSGAEMNVAVGNGAMQSLTTGDFSVALGNSANYGSTTASNNTAIGYQSLFVSNSGNNTALGYWAGRAVTGTDNTLIGTQAGMSGSNNLTSGSNNTLIGHDAAASSSTVSNEITLGDSNVNHLRVPGIGVSFSEGGGVVTGIMTASSFKLLDGSAVGGVDSDSNQNTVAGTNAGDSFSGNNAAKNTLFGYDAGTGITSADNTTCIGYEAGKSITTNSGSTCIGYQAGSQGNNEYGIFIGHKAGYSVTGGSNFAAGLEAMGSATSASSCQAIGNYALMDGGSSEYMIAIGQQALQYPSGGTDKCIALGRSALRQVSANSNIAIGYNAGNDNNNTVSGIGNIIIGDEAANTLTSGANNLLLGRVVSQSLTTGSNNIVLGYDAEPSSATVSNEVTIGDSNITTLRVPGIGFNASGTGHLDVTGNSARFRTIESGGSTVEIRSGGSEGYVGTTSNHKVSLITNSTRRWEISGAGHFIPYANNTYDIGSSSYRVRNLYTHDLNLSNEGSKNDVDGTWGNYTIQEGESDLFLINKRNGKKYKFNLTEVS